MRYFPAFLDIRDRKVIVIGGNLSALKKAELMFRAGARVCVLNSKSEKSTEVIPVNTPYEIFDRHWEPSDFADTVIIISAISDEEENTSIAHYAKLNGSLFNAVDKPKISNFTTPAIVERGDIVIGVSTGGIAPVLARRVRLAIDSALPENLDLIANGEKDSMSCIKDTYEPFRVNLEEKLTSVDISETRELKNLGIHPDTGRPVTVRLTKYGPTIQMGTKEDEEKPKWAALTYEQKKNIDGITMDDAIRLFALPEKIGVHNKEDIFINIGPFGPYLKWGKTNVSVRGQDIFTIEEDEAIELIKEKLEIDANRDIKIFEESGIKVLNGRFGPYITNGKVNAKIPKDVDPKSLDENTCIELIKNAPKRKFRRKFRAKKTT